MSLPRPCLPIRNKRNRKREYPSESAENQTPVEISSLETMNAMEYLASVKEQASSLPDVFVSPVPKDEDTMVVSSNGDGGGAIDGSAAARNYLFSHRLDILPPPSPAHAPSAEHFSSWKESTIRNFSSLRMYLDTCCTELKSVMKMTDRIKVPKSKDLYAWHIFCLGDRGRMEMEMRMIDVQMSGLNYNATAVEIDVELAQYNIPSEGYEPTTKLMSQFDQIIIRRLLSHHTQFVSAGCTISVERMKWVYAVLAMLEKPLHRDEASILTELLRGLCRARAIIDLSPVDGDNKTDVEGNNMVVKAINVSILLIGIYFEQCTDETRVFGAPN